MEVMGLMLGDFIDDYTVRVVDVFAMPQSGTGVSVEAVDPVFQTRMLEMLKQTGRYAETDRETERRTRTRTYSVS
jgi:26S proteasome regulatory subunit N11